MVSFLVVGHNGGCFFLQSLNSPDFQVWALCLGLPALLPGITLGWSGGRCSIGGQANWAAGPTPL